MKIKKTEVKELMEKHIHSLSEEELNKVAFLLDIEITKFKKSDHQIAFTMTHKLSTVMLECSKGSSCSIGRTNKVKNGLSGLTSWGGCFSLASAIKIFRGFFCMGYELTLQSPEKQEHYSKKEWKETVLLANDSIEVA